MNNDMSILHLVLNASWVVQFVMLLLLVVSVASWAAIFRKHFSLRRINADNDEFEDMFWSGTSLNELYASSVRHANKGAPLERIFASGCLLYTSPSPRD